MGFFGMIQVGFFVGLIFYFIYGYVTGAGK